MYKLHSFLLVVVNDTKYKDRAISCQSDCLDAAYIAVEMT